MVLKNENKSDDMVDIMKHMHQYVPYDEYEEEQMVEGIAETVTVTKASAYPILFGGDQLTAARARSARKAKVNSVVPAKRFHGLIPVAEDWHTRMNYLGVSFEVRY